MSPARDSGPGPELEQVAFLGVELRSPIAEEREVLVTEAPGEPVNASDAAQLELFADKVALERDIGYALQSGCFAEARRLRDVHHETYGATPATARLGFLDALERADWDGGPATALSAWGVIDADLRGDLSLRRMLRHGVFCRLLAVHTPAALAETHPPCLGALVTFLTAEALGAGDPSSAAARRLVRDALLTGRSLEADEIEGDPSLADLLGEDLPPRWLACLGGVRGLWPLPPATQHELSDFDEQDGLPDDEALRFWHCLRVARTPGCPQALRYEARRRMKTLQPGLHAAYMRRAALAES